MCSSDLLTADALMTMFMGNHHVEVCSLPIIPIAREPVETYHFPLLRGSYLQAQDPVLVRFVILPQAVFGGRVLHLDRE